MTALILLMVVAAIVAVVLIGKKEKPQTPVSTPVDVVPPPVDPVLPPVDVVPPPPVPTISRPMNAFELLVVQGLDLATITARLGRDLTPDELAYARAAKVPGSVPTDQPPPSPTSPKVDYSTYRGETRGSIELAVKQGLILPEGWSWPDAFASGFVKDTAAIDMGGSTTPNSDDRRDGVLAWRLGGSMIEEFEGPAGEYRANLPVPADFEGTLQCGCYGERGTSSFGGRIEKFDFFIQHASGAVIESELGSGGSGAMKTITVGKNFGPITLAVKTYMGGIGYFQVNAYPKGSA